MTNPDLVHALGQTLRMYREMHQMTQIEVAKAIGISSQAYSHYETGRRAPTPQNFIKLSALYGVPMSTFLTGTPDSAVQLAHEIAACSEAEQREIQRFIQFLKYRHQTDNDT